MPESSSKHRRKRKRVSKSSNIQILLAPQLILELYVWNFSGAWMLELGFYCPNSRVKISQLAQRRIILRPLRRRAADDDVVHHFDFQKLPGADQIPRHLDVRLARRRVAARMIVNQDNSRRVRHNRRAKHLARMHENRVEQTL